jgi:hypothetical protein
MPDQLLTVPEQKSCGKDINANPFLIILCGTFLRVRFSLKFCVLFVIALYFSKKKKSQTKMVYSIEQKKFFF